MAQQPTAVPTASQPPRRAAIYARCSTNHQDPTMQLDELRAYCQQRGFTACTEYVDAGVSGKRARRPQLDALMVAARKRKVDAVVVYRYDRFARSLHHLAAALEEFRALGVDFISLHEGVDTSTPGGRLVFGIFASIAEFERELIRERVCSGLATARRRGKRLGRPQQYVNLQQLRQYRSEELSWARCAQLMRKPISTLRRVYLQSISTPAQ